MDERSCLFVFVSSLFASCPETFPSLFTFESKTKIPIWCVFYLFSLSCYTLPLSTFFLYYYYFAIHRDFDSHRQEFIQNVEKAKKEKEK